MGLLKRVEIRNFKCFRDWVGVDLNQSTYFVGANNSGKTAVLSAVAAFFDDEKFDPTFINKTELAARREGANRSEVKVTFDLDVVPGRARQARLKGIYGPSVSVTKQFIWREASETLTVQYKVSPRPDSLGFEDMEKDLRELISSVSVSYIHPQEGVELLRRAQAKFKQRLFHNWGRHASVAERVKAVQEKWVDLRATANNYLSQALSARLKDIWPGAEVKVDLPERIQDIVAVSDITFRSSPNLPQVTLPSHGTGAQSIILYQTHYLLDSDRTLHQGMYFPVWLLEEPESFLHADIAVQLSHLLSSPEWLASIQMMVSTHSPVVLAGSRGGEGACSWAVLDGHDLSWPKSLSQIGEDDVEKVGLLMGDPNFGVYFEASARGARVFLEDSRHETRECFERAGMSVTASLKGVTEVKRYLSVLESIGDMLPGQFYFIVDADEGLKQLQPYLGTKPQFERAGRWKKCKVAPSAWIVVLPEGAAAEDLFEEWEDTVEDAWNDVFDADGVFRESVPVKLTRLASQLRSRAGAGKDELLGVFKKSQDVKDRFWERSGEFEIQGEHIEALHSLLPPEVFK